MKQDKIKQMVCEQLNELGKLFKKIIVDFQTKDIHDFRTGIKKLRAFLRLLNNDLRKEDHFLIPEKIKIFYRHTGHIRNLQLQQKELETIAEGSVPDYIHDLEKEVGRYKEKIAGLQLDFSEEAGKVIQALPGKLNKAIKKFVHKKLERLAGLLAQLPGEETLHSIRKLLKDILYNWDFVKPYRKLMPDALSGKKKIKNFTEKLGQFNDKCIALAGLKNYETTGSGDDKKIPRQLKLKWQEEKDSLEKQIYEQLQLIEFQREKLLYSVNID